MDNYRRLADDASRVAEDELAVSSGRSDLLLSSCHFAHCPIAIEVLTTS